jgi:hypothetical protein
VFREQQKPFLVTALAKVPAFASLLGEWAYRAKHIPESVNITSPAEGRKAPASHRQLKTPGINTSSFDTVTITHQFHPHFNM